MRDLEDGRGSWDADRRMSTSAVRDYGERVVLEVVDREEEKARAGE
jgi:hypothetical protein